MSDLRWTIDVSNFQPRDLSEIIAQHRPQGGIVRLNMPAWEPIPDGITQAQVKSFRDHGLPVGVYGWARGDIDPIRQFNGWIDLCAQMNLVVPIVWIDCEIITNSAGAVLDAGPDASWLRRVRDHARDLQTPIGIYTGKWWVDAHFPGGWREFKQFNDLPAWVSEYDIEPGLENVNPMWRTMGFRVVGHQWSGSPIDRNVMLAEFVENTAPIPEDPCKDLREELKAATAMYARLRAYSEVKPYKAMTKRTLLEMLRGR